MDKKGQPLNDLHQEKKYDTQEILRFILNL